MKKKALAILAVALVWSVVSVCQALTAGQVLELKKAGVEDETIRMMMAQEAQAKGQPEAMGVREIRDREGNTVIRYSVGEGNSAAARAEEARKVEKAWEMLRNLRIDNR